MQIVKVVNTEGWSGWTQSNYNIEMLTQLLVFTNNKKWESFTLRDVSSTQNEDDLNTLLKTVFEDPK